MGASVAAILEILAAIRREAAAAGADEAADDLERMDSAARRLAALVGELADDGAVASRAGSDIETLCAALRHDLRTPINALKGYGEILLEDCESEGAAPLAAGLRDLLSHVETLLRSIDLLIRPPRGGGPPAPHTAGQDEASGMIEALARSMEAETARRAVPRHHGCILVVDDNQNNREVLERALVRDGHRVVLAGSGRQALELVGEYPFDLILLDVMMPEMSGFEVLVALKRDEDRRAVPVIMISALDEVASIARCLEAGAEDYLGKPFNPVLLRVRINASLERKRLRDLERAYLAAVEQELNVARDLQTSILPKTFPVGRGMVGHGLMVPAREVGGDFYDFIPLDGDRMGIAIGDVSGKGVPAALFMAISRTLLRVLALSGLPPGECLARLNDLLCEENDQSMFVTLIYGILDRRNGSFTYANGGHHWPALIKADGAVRWVEGEGGNDMLLGVIKDNDYHDREIRLDVGDMIFLYTDGVIEAFDTDGHEFTSQRLAKVLGWHGWHTPERLIGAVLDAVRAFERGADQTDDITCVAVRLDRSGSEDGWEEIRIANRVRDLSQVVAALEEFCRRHDIPARIQGHLDLALDEIVTNVISYAYDDGARHEILVRLRLDGRRVEAEVVDDGCHHVPLERPPPELDKPLEERTIGGLGIHLVKTLMDTVEYRRENGHNHLYFSKCLD
jgi:sigma-B regulation protein RsbU (phosphoserine phosphatase)